MNGMDYSKKKKNMAIEKINKKILYKTDWHNVWSKNSYTWKNLLCIKALQLISFHRSCVQFLANSNQYQSEKTGHRIEWITKKSLLFYSGICVCICGKQSVHKSVYRVGLDIVDMILPS